MANEIITSYITGLTTLTANAYYEDSSSITERETDIALTEFPVGSGIYSGDSDLVQDGDIINIYNSSSLIGSAIYSSIALTSDGIETIVQTVLETNNLDNTWHVAKTGNDSNGGHSFTDALLTIPAAITDASAGDTIYIHPGTYDKDADGGAVVVNKNLTIIGSGQEKTIITNSTSNYGIQITADNVKVYFLSSKATYSWLGVGGYGIYVSEADNTVIDNCYSYGNGDGIYISTSSKNCRITNSIGESQYDGINVVNSIGTFIDKCIFITTGEWTAADVRGITSSTGCDNLIIKDTQVIASRALDGAGYHLTGIETYGNVILDNVNVTAYHTGTGAHTTKGIDVITGKLLADKININVVASEGTVYDVVNAGGEIVINNSLYDSAQTSGTITDKTNNIENQTDQLSFTGTDVNATLDGETVDLSATGLDNISASEPTGRATTFREMAVQLWMRFFNKVDRTSTQIRVYDADGSIVTTQSHSEAGGTVTVDKSS